jgi:hypothetical protein
MTRSPIQFEKSPDGTYELTYFGKVAGWARKAAHLPNVWRALSVRGEIRHARSLDAARAALLEMYH